MLRALFPAKSLKLRGGNPKSKLSQEATTEKWAVTRLICSAEQNELTVDFYPAPIADKDRGSR